MDALLQCPQVNYRGPWLRGGGALISNTAALRQDSLSFVRANLNIQKSLKHLTQDTEKLNRVLERCVRCTHREPRLTDSKTESSSPSRPPAPEQTNTKSQFKHANWKRKSPIQHITHEGCVSTRLNHQFASPCFCTDNKCIQNDVKTSILQSILEKTVG